MISATYQSMPASTAADHYAHRLGIADARDEYIEKAARFLARSWRNDWEKIFEVVAEADKAHSKSIGMAISTMLDKQQKNATVGIAFLAEAVDDLLYREAEKQVRKELENERNSDDGDCL